MAYECQKAAIRKGQDKRLKSCSLTRAVLHFKVTTYNFEKWVKKNKSESEKTDKNEN